MKSCSISTIFWFLLAIFVFITLQMTLPAIRDLFRGSVFLLPVAVFFLLGLALMLATLKQQARGKLKKFLLLTGASAVGFFAGVILHNAFYALAVVAKEITVLKYIFEGLHVFFFLIAIPVCPIAFLVGMMGSIILLVKKGRQG